MQSNSHSLFVELELVNLIGINQYLKNSLEMKYAYWKMCECFKGNATLAAIPVMVDLQLSKKLILEPLVKVHIVKQLIGCQSHCIVNCGQNNHNTSQKNVIVYYQRKI